MHLVLATDDKTLDKIPIDPARYKDQPYLAALRRLLAIKHHLEIRSLKEDPVCYLLLPSRMHRIKTAVL